MWMAAYIRQAPRQPHWSTGKALNGQQTVLAKPPKSVTCVMALRASSA
jgi:hypothetical protein